MKKGSLVYHPEYGVLTVTRKHYSASKNKFVWYAKDEQGKERALTGDEQEYKPIEKEEQIKEEKELKVSLNGVSEIKGDKGEDGKDGKDGYNGKDGENGKDGKDGVTPIKGVDYFDGEDGKDGKNGLDGRDGKDGRNGLNGKDGKDGEKGDKLKHKWSGTKLAFENPTGEWGEEIDLKGEPGQDGGGNSFNAQVGASSSDGQPGFLMDKLIAGTNITLEKSDGINETIIINAIGDGTGDVHAPVINTDSYIPQWDGANSKTLKNGLAVPAGGLAGLTALNLKATQNPGISAETPIPASAISINYTSKVLTITPPLGYFDFFTDGGGVITKHTKTGNVDFPAFTNTSGIWYFHFNSTGTAVTTQTPWTDFNTIATVYRIIWNATLTGADADLGNDWECHLNTISADDHAWKHTYGTVWEKGFDMCSTPLASGSPSATGLNTCISLKTGTNSDDGLQYTVTNGTGASLWTQDMGNTTPASITVSNAGQFPIRYQDGAGLVYNIPATRFPFAYSAGNLIEFITSTGTRTVPDSGNYVVYFAYAFADPRNGKTVKLVSASSQYTTLANAQAVTWDTITSVYPTLADKEIRPLHRMIFDYRTTYDIAVKKSRLREVSDIRTAKATTATAIVGSVPASSVTVVPAGNIASTNAQSALEELDTEKLQLSGIAGGQTAIGGTAVTDVLKLQGTSGNGTLTSPAVQVKVGNNGGTTAWTVLNNGNHGIGTTTPTSKLQVVGLPAYADNTEALAGGLTAGAFYRTSAGVLMVTY